jgi:hypothetical protein
LDLHLWPHPRYPALSPAIDQCAACRMSHVAFALGCQKECGLPHRIHCAVCRSAGTIPFTHSHRVRSLRPRSEVTARCARLGAWPRDTDVNVARSIRVQVSRQSTETRRCRRLRSTPRGCASWHVWTPSTWCKGRRRRWCGQGICALRSTARAGWTALHCCRTRMTLLSSQDWPGGVGARPQSSWLSKSCSRLPPSRSWQQVIHVPALPPSHLHSFHQG